MKAIQEDLYMKKFWKVLLPCLLCTALLAAFTGCSGYESETIAYTGEKGSMVFLGVNFNETNSRSDGVKIQVNFAHESVSAEEVPYSIYVGTVGNLTSVYTLPLSFSTDEGYNTEAIEDEFIPGMVAYTCNFPKGGAEVTLPDSLFSESSGTFLVMLVGGDYSAGSDYADREFTYSVSGDTVTLS